MKTAIIVNPNSGGGKTAAFWAQIRDEVNLRLGGVEELMTQAQNDATRFARDIASDPQYSKIIVAGGDGTINEVANGLFDDEHKPLNPNLQIGILSVGRGCDFVKSVDIPANYREALGIIKNPRILKSDVGLAVFKDQFGREQHRYFVNIATAGLAGQVAKGTKDAPRWMTPEMTYFWAAAKSFLKYSATPMKVTIDGEVVHEGPCLNVFVANGSFSGAGMHWAPEARVDDGQFDIVIVPNLPKSKLLTLAYKIYDGTFNKLPGIINKRGREVSVETTEQVLLEIDGEQPGTAPVAYKIISKALNLLVSP